VCSPAVPRIRLQKKRELALPAKLLMPDLPLDRPDDFADLHICDIFLTPDNKDFG
jgi:hypothetical protein